MLKPNSSTSAASHKPRFTIYPFSPVNLTLATMKRESNSWRYPAIMAGYLFAMAYLASFLTYQIAVALGAG